MAERTGAVAFNGQPLTLLGDELQPGVRAADFEVLGADLNPVRLSSFVGKIVVISAVPSLDTPVCDLETRRFNTEAARLGPDVVILTVSMDLPFAQKRWCQAAGADQIVLASDHRDGQFGLKYGVLIKELRLLARCLFVIDAAGTLVYRQLVREIANEPDYDEVLQVVRALKGARR